MNLLNIKGIRKLVALVIANINVAYFTEGIESLIVLALFSVYVGANIVVNGQYSIRQKK